MKQKIKNIIKILVPYSVIRKYHKSTLIKRLLNPGLFASKIKNTYSENLYLNINNKSYNKIKDDYNKNYKDKSFWEDWFDDYDFKNFKGENVFVTQLTGLKNIKLAYQNTINFAVDNDFMNLMNFFDEDNKFGVESIILNDEIFSRDRIDSVIEINYFSKLLGLTRNSALRIFDIGAGYGRLSYRLLQAFPNSYVFCGDVVPQATFLCDYYLKYKGFNETHFNCGSYHEALDQNEFDIAINIHSFSEAPYESIRKWLDIINIKKTKHIFIVPSGNDLVSMEHDGYKKDYMNYIFDLGYELVDKSPKFKEKVFNENLCLSPTNYYLFKKVN